MPRCRCVPYRPACRVSTVPCQSGAGDGRDGTVTLCPHPWCVLGHISIPLPCRMAWLLQAEPIGALGVPCCARRLCQAMPTSGAVAEEMGCWGTGAGLLPVLPALTPLPTFLPGCSFSEFLGRAATANSLFLARVICTRWLCCVPTAGFWGVRSSSGPGSPQALDRLPAWGPREAPVGTQAQPCVPLQVPAGCGGDAQPHRGEGPRAGGR